MTEVYTQQNNRNTTNEIQLNVICKNKFIENILDNTKNTITNLYRLRSVFAVS